MTKMKKLTKKQINWYDFIIGKGSFVLCIAIIPTVIDQTVLPFLTTFLTCSVLTIFTFTFAHMKYRYAAIVDAFSAIGWGFLTVVSIAGHSII